MREAGDPDFSSTEVALLKRVAPHVGAGLKAAALRSRATAEPAPGDAPGVLTLDRSGRVLSHTPAAERWLQDLEDLDPSWPEGRPPMAIAMVTNAVRRALNPRIDRDLNLIPRVRLRGRSGRWLTLHASLTEASNDSSGQTVVVVVEPSRPEEVAWLNVAAHGLTSREAEVVKLVVRGLSTKQISRRLFISEHTVQRHLQNAFEKAGARSRQELLKRLFFEDLLPGILSG